MKRHRQAIKTINDILHSWDPIGMRPMDEYHELAIKLFERIELGQRKEQLVTFVDHYLHEWLGIKNISPEDIEAHVLSIITAVSYIDNS